MYIKALMLILVLFGTHQEVSAQSSLVEIGIGDSLFSNILKEQREIWVELPVGYHSNSSFKYPVVYVLDGGVQLNTLATVANNYAGHFLPHMILVGIANHTNRTRDLTTSQVTMNHGYPVNEPTGGAEEFTQFIEKELIPYIDSKFRTTPYRTLIGHSYGGLFTIHTLINHPSLFENYIAADPSIEWDNQRFLLEAKQKLQEENYEGNSLFVSLAATSLHMQNEDITMDNVMQDTSDHSLFARSIIEFAEFAEKQTQNGLNFSWKHYPNDLHGTVPLPTMRDGLISHFEWYQLKSFWKFNDPETPIDVLVDLFETRAEILSKHFGYPSAPAQEELFNQLGYMYLQMEQLEKSRAFFEMSLRYYSESANAYDSMADYYESQGDYINALKFITQAFEINATEYYKNRMEEFKAKK